MEKNTSSAALLVMKFGGTSVGSAERMKVACDLIAAEAARRPVLAVVSAMSRITDLLLDTTRYAEGGDQTRIDNNLRQLEERHFEAAAGLLPASQRARLRKDRRDRGRVPAHREWNTNVGPSPSPHGR